MEPPKRAAHKAPAQDFPLSRNRLRIGTGHPQRPPPISQDEIVAELIKLGCGLLIVQLAGTDCFVEIQLVVSREQAFIITVREEDMAAVANTTLQIRHHRTRVDVYQLKTTADLRMEESAAPANSQHDVEFRVISTQRQPFTPAKGSENQLRLVLRNHSDFPKWVRRILWP